MFFSDIIWQYIDSKKGNSNYISTIGNNDFYSLCVLTACIKSGYIFVPIDSKNSDERIQNIIDDIKPKVIIRGSKCKKVGNSILFEDIINRNCISNTLTIKKGVSIFNKAALFHKEEWFSFPLRKIRPRVCAIDARLSF